MKIGLSSILFNGADLAITTFFGNWYDSQKREPGP